MLEKCVNAKCSLAFKPEDFEAACKWWGNNEPPVAYSDFMPNCKDAITKATEE